MANKWGVTVHTYTKNSLRGGRNCTDFELKDVSGVRMRTSVKNFRISAQGVLRVPKIAKNGYFRGGICDNYSSNGTISGSGNHLGD